MPTGPEDPRASRRAPRAATALAASAAALALLLPSGCGKGGDAVEVDVEQQREMNKLLTDDYSKTYREKYAGGQGKAR